jgi:hypothetical protein
MALLGPIFALITACEGSRPVVLDGAAALLDRGPDRSLVDQAADQQAPGDGRVDMADALAIADAALGFPEVLEGVWLVGWMGGLNRFSWIRFSVTSATEGTAIIDRGTLGSGTVPYWNCSGSTQWNITVRPDTIQLHYPSGECTGARSGLFTFTRIDPASENYPRGAELLAVIEVAGVSPDTISGYKFPPDQCDAAMTTCTDPL